MKIYEEFPTNFAKYQSRTHLLITSTAQHNLIPMPFALVHDNFVDLLLPRGLLAITLFAAVGVGEILP